MESLASVDELKTKLEWDLDPGEERAAESALEELSDEARFHGSAAWEDEFKTPEMVRRIVLKAAARWMRNPDGYTQSRAGDETVAWSDKGDGAGSAQFTDREIEMLKVLANKSTLHSVPMRAWDSKELPETGYVPVDSSHVEGKSPDFPFFREDYI